MLDFIRRSIKLSGDHRSKMNGGIFFLFIKEFVLLLSFVTIYLGFSWMEDLNSTKIWTLFFILLGALLFSFIANWYQSKMIAGVFFTVYRDYRLEVGEKLKKAPMGYFNEQSLSKILACFTNVIKTLENFSQLTFMFTIAGMSVSFFILLGMFGLNVKMGILALILVAIAWLLVRIMFTKMKNLMNKEHVATAKLNDALVDGIRGVSVLRSFPNLGDAKVKEIHSGVYETAEALRNIQKRGEFVFTIYSKIYGTFLSVSSLVMTLYAAVLYINGGIALAEALTLCVASFMLFNGLRQLENAAVLLVKSPSQLDYLEEVLNVPRLEDGDMKDFENYDIAFENVKFAYGDNYVINDISFDIKEGDKVAIVGPSGSGKTTIVNLLSRFYDVNEGAIKIGGKNIKDYEVDSLLKNLSLVFQDVYLFNDTIKSNIMFAKPEASDDEVRAAAKRAMCHEFIMKMPSGYDSLVGEGGSTLSGGEKQRVSIARALLKDAPIILLDEATSSVDPENEYEILRAIEELTKGRTVISIAHRLSTVKNADKILVIENGKLVQSGKHDELISVDGVYKDFINAREKASNWEIKN